MSAMIEVKNFRMTFNNKTVIRDLSFEVKKGEIFGMFHLCMPGECKSPLLAMQKLLV